MKSKNEKIEINITKLIILMGLGIPLIAMITYSLLVAVASEVFTSLPLINKLGAKLTIAVSLLILILPYLICLACYGFFLLVKSIHRNCAIQIFEDRIIMMDRFYQVEIRFKDINGVELIDEQNLTNNIIKQTKPKIKIYYNNIIIRNEKYLPLWLKSKIGLGQSPYLISNVRLHLYKSSPRDIFSKISSFKAEYDLIGKLT